MVRWVAVIGWMRPSKSAQDASSASMICGSGSGSAAGGSSCNAEMTCVGGDHRGVSGVIPSARRITRPCGVFASGSKRRPWAVTTHSRVASAARTAASIGNGSGASPATTVIVSAPHTDQLATGVPSGANMPGAATMPTGTPRGNSASFSSPMRAGSAAWPAISRADAKFVTGCAASPTRTYSVPSVARTIGASPGSPFGRIHANSPITPAIITTAAVPKMVARRRAASGSWIMRISPKIRPCSIRRRMNLCPDTWARVVGKSFAMTIPLPREKHLAQSLLRGAYLRERKQLVGAVFLPVCDHVLQLRLAELAVHREDRRGALAVDGRHAF